MVVPEYGAGWRCKLVLPSLLEGERLNLVSLTVRDPDGAEASQPHVASRVSPAGRRHQLQAARAQDARVLPRGPAALRGRRHAQPARVRPGLLRQAGRRRSGHQAHRPPVQDAGIRARRRSSGCRTRSSSAPPTTDTFSLPQSQEEFYFALPYEQMDQCLWAHDHRLSPEEAARAVGLTAEQVERVYRDIEAKRRATRYLHHVPCTHPDDRKPEAMCGIAGAMHPRRRTPAPDRRGAWLARWRAASGTGAPTSSASTWRPRGPRLRPPRHHRHRLRPAAHVGRRRGALAGVQRRDLQLPRAARGAGSAGHAFRTRSDTEVIVQAWRAWGDRGLRALQRPVRASRSGSPTETLVLARDRYGVQPLYLCEHDGRLWFGSEVEGDLRGRPSIPRAFDPVGLAETFTFWASVAPQGVFGGITELNRGMCGWSRAGASRDERLLAARVRRAGERARSGSVDDAADAGPGQPRAGGRPAHAARGRPGRQLPLRRAGQLAHRGLGPRSPRGTASTPTPSASTTRSTTRRA